MFEIILDKFPTHIARTKNKVAADKMMKINNQAIYNSNLNRFARNIVMNNLHHYILSVLKPYKKTFLREGMKYPLSIKVFLYTVKNHGSVSMRGGKICWKPPTKKYIPTWDIENLATIWIKAINDSLVMGGFIPDDNIYYINNISYEYIEVKDLDDRKLIIRIK